MYSKKCVYYIYYQNRMLLEICTREKLNIVLGIEDRRRELGETKKRRRKKVRIEREWRVEEEEEDE